MTDKCGGRMRGRGSVLSRCGAFAVIYACAHVGASALASDVYRIDLLGFTDAEHTSPTGARYSGARMHNDAGFVVGEAGQYTGQEFISSYSAWAYDPRNAALHRIGLTDPFHTRSDGTRYSAAQFMNASGAIVGKSNNYTGDHITEQGDSVWYFNPNNPQSTEIGLLTAEHAGILGIRFNDATSMNDLGFVGGHSQRFNGGAHRGKSAWIFDPNTGITKRLGLFDAAHTGGPGGFRITTETALNKVGQIAGHSNRYSGTTVIGSTAWLYDPATQVQTVIGLTGPDFTNSSGVQSNFAVQVGDGGHVIGGANRYGSGGSGELGFTAWIHDAATNQTRAIGLTGPQHTASDGRQIGAVDRVNQLGIVFGRAARYSGVTSTGTSVWSYDHRDAVTTQIGFFDGVHTHQDGTQVGTLGVSNAKGHVFGQSVRWSGSTMSLGNSAWQYDPATKVTTRVGLIDAAHTYPDGSQHSSVTAINANGDGMGTSSRNPSMGKGVSAWSFRHDTGTTHRIGLVDAQHTGSTGRQVSFPRVMNEQGDVMGTSNRIANVNDDRGNSAWIADADTGITTRIGLFDAAHTSFDLQQRTEPVDLNEAGQAIGWSFRYASPFGFSYWFYDPTLGTIPMTFPISPDLTARGNATVLDESGTVFGSATYYNSASVAVGTTAFSWSIAEGFQDLAALVPDGIEAAGWARLSYVSDVLAGDRVLGGGLRADTTSGFMAFVLAPIPEPASGAIMLTAGIGLLRRVRRASCLEMSGRTTRA